MNDQAFSLPTVLLREVCEIGERNVAQRAAPGSSDVTMLGNDPARRESSQGQMPLSIPRWIARTAATPSQERLLEEAADAMASVGDVAPPAWMPLRVGNQVLMRSTERLYGLDFQTGKMIWQYPWFDSNEEPEASDLAALLMEEESGQSLLKQRVWNDLPYGRITSDGKRVFMLADLAEVELVESMGSEIYAYFSADASEFGETKLAEVAEQVGYEAQGAKTDQVIARLDPDSAVKRRDRQELWFNSSQIHLFDPDTGETLSTA